MELIEPEEIPRRFRTRMGEPSFLEIDNAGLGRTTEALSASPQRTPMPRPPIPLPDVACHAQAQRTYANQSQFDLYERAERPRHASPPGGTGV